MAPRNQGPDQESPFYVHPSEGPSSLIVSPKLDGSSYLAWNRSMKRSLGTKNKLGFINGSIEQPDLDDLNRSAWERCNHLVQSWLINSVSDSIAQIVVFYVIAFEVWQDLHESFSKVDRIRITNLRSSINNLKQGAKYVLEYFTELKALWEELSSHRPIPSCICVHACHCDATRVAKIYRTEDQIMQFLTSLNDNFGVVKTQVLLLDPLPPLKKVYSLVVQEESNNSLPISVSASDDSNIQLNASEVKKSQGRGKGSFVHSQKPTRYCTFCHKTNHTVDFCYQKHGHPSFPKQQSRVNAATHEILDENGALDYGLGGSTGSDTCLSPEQYTQLVSLLQQASLVSSSSLPFTSNATTNHVQVTPFVSISISATPPDNASIPSKPNYWLLDSGAN